MQLQKIVPRQDLKQLIDSRLTPYDIIRYYVGNDVKLGVVMRSPLSGHKHGDRSNSFSIGCSKSGRLIWKDHALDKCGGWTDLVADMYGLTYPQVLQKVAGDFGLLVDDTKYQRIVSTYKQPVIEPEHHTLIQVTARSHMRKMDLEYWKQYLITEEELHREQVFSISELYINRQKVIIDKGERVYAYKYPEDRYKIYMVDRPKGERWKMNVSNTHVENLENLNGDAKVLISKSKKDRITLQKIVPYTVLNVQNEGISGYTEEFRKQLEDREVIICYDADDPGVRNCKKICDTYGYRYVNTPRYMLEHEVKDPSDWVKHVGRYDELQEFLHKKNVI